MDLSSLANLFGPPNLLPWNRPYRRADRLNRPAAFLLLREAHE